MFANRFTAFVDACSLAGALHRNLLLTLAEAEFFRLRWSEQVLDEAQTAIARILAHKGAPDALERAATARRYMATAFADASVDGYETFMSIADGLPDPGDAHVLAAAVKARAHVLVTDNLRDFPAAILEPFDLRALSTDQFLANTIDLDQGRAVAAIRKMRERLNRPEKTAEALFRDMEAAGLTEAVDALRPHILSL